MKKDQSKVSTVLNKTKRIVIEHLHIMFKNLLGKKTAEIAVYEKKRNYGKKKKAEIAF